jgi:hypothetical protein
MPVSISCCRQAYDFDAEAPKNRWARSRMRRSAERLSQIRPEAANRASGEALAEKWAGSG